MKEGTEKSYHHHLHDSTDQVFLVIRTPPEDKRWVHKARGGDWQHWVQMLTAMNQAVASAVLARTVRRCKQRVGRVNSPAGPRNSLHPAAIPSHNVQSGLWPASTRPVGTGSHLDWPTATSSLQSTHYSSQPVFLHISAVYHFSSRQLCLSTFEAFWSIVTLLHFVYI